MAKLAGRGLNTTDNLECEDSRSSQFVMQWNAMLLHLSGVMAVSQVVTRKDADSTCKSDVVLAKLQQDESHADFSTVVDFSVVIEWKCNWRDGADREGAHYAMQLKDATSRNKFLVLTVSSNRVEVFGLYWIALCQDKKAKRVKLGMYCTLEDCLTEWLPALIWFVLESSEDLAPTVPRFSSSAIESTLLKNQTYKVVFIDEDRLFKVFGYVNRPEIELRRGTLLSEGGQKYSIHG